MWEGSSAERLLREHDGAGDTEERVQTGERFSRRTLPASVTAQ